MAPSKRKREDESNWTDDRPAQSRKSVSETAETEPHQVLGNYETLSSHRPTRQRKPPQRLCDEVQPATKRKTTLRKPSRAGKSSRTTKIARRTSVQSKVELSPDSQLNQHEDGASQSPKKSKIVALKVSPSASVPSQDVMRTNVPQSDAYNRTPLSGLLDISNFGSPNEGHASQTPPLQHFQSVSLFPTPNTAVSHGASIGPVSDGELQEHLPADEPHGGQATFLLGHGQPLNENGDSLSHDTQECGAATTAVGQSPSDFTHLEDWLVSQNITKRVNPSGHGFFTQPAATYTDSEATIECDDTTRPFMDGSLCLLDDQQLHAISKQLHAQRNIGVDKPMPMAQPEVWAEGRQELCETLHFYRSYQGACYATGGFVRGFMFDKVAHERDYIDSNVVISRAVGGLTKDKESGAMKASRDQVEDSVALGLKNCMLYRNPVVVITGIDNPHIPSKPPHQYCVLDYFKPTHIWAEKSGSSVMFRYRFEKLNSKKESWWQARDGTKAIELGLLPKPVEKTCGSCGVDSQQIYLNGWMCLQPNCRSFWKMAVPASGRGRRSALQEPDETTLLYDPRFLKQKTVWENDDQEYPLVSNTAELSTHPLPGEDTSVAFWSGIVCPDCGRCISRLNWTKWECPNPTCDYIRSPPHALISALALRDPLWPVTDSYTLSRDTLSPLVGFSVHFEHGYRINRYTLPGIDGFITHMVANKRVLEEHGGPDTMFEELQQTDIGLQRRPLPTGQLKGPNYCRQFLVNYGMPYKFVAATQSHSFDGAARPITHTRSRLNWAAQYLLSRESGTTSPQQAWNAATQFNEVLALGYFQEQKINYHDDGEFGLGPTTATLSLGAPGTMRIRMKARRYHGMSSVAGVYDDVAPVPGCEQYDARAALQPELEALRATDTKAYNARRKQIPKELGLHSRGQSAVCAHVQVYRSAVVEARGQAGV
ncbi:hypothetical protein ACJQWK_06914 [Exserohilum turcicum]